MGRQPLFSIAALAVSVIVVFLAPLAGQESDYTPARTPWGDPDLRGHYLPGTSQPLETPRLEPWGDTQYTATTTRSAASSAPRAMRRRGRASGADSNDHRSARRPRPAAGMGRRKARRDHGAAGGAGAPRPAREVSAGRGAAVHLPVGYNTYQILQVPGAVIFLYEWNHHSRYVPLDGRPHVAADIKLGMGDPRGHWEGNTLVIDSTNFTDNTWPVGHGAPPEGAPASSISSGHGVFHSGLLHVVERFTPVDAGTINYEATIEDPNVFTQPWTLRYEGLKRAPEGHILYEYACHEGNGRNLKLMTGTDFQ